MNGTACPNCKSLSIRRSRRKNVAERALSLAYLPWRCTACDSRFFRPRNSDGGAIHKTPIYQTDSAAPLVPQGQRLIQEE